MVAEEITSHHRDERHVEVRDQPHALIEDGQIVRRLTVAVVERQAEVREPHDVGDDQESGDGVAPLEQRVPGPTHQTVADEPETDRRGRRLEVEVVDEVLR